MKNFNETVTFLRKSVIYTLLTTIIVIQNTSAQWEKHGLMVADTIGYQKYPRVCNDGAGGAIIVWQDSRTDTTNRHFWDVYAQRVDSSGHFLWPRNGVPIAYMPEYQQSPILVSDEESGAIIAWQDFRNCFFGKDLDIYAQRINSKGKILWAENGVPVVSEKGDQEVIWDAMIADGKGGAILVWTDARSGGYPEDDIYAQRINARGEALWDSGGVAVCKAPSFQGYAYLCTDGKGGAIISWFDKRKDQEIYAQRVDSSGHSLWHKDGIFIAKTYAYSARPARISSDSCGGAYLVWNESKNVKLQRISSDGVLVWGTNGLIVYPGTGWPPRIATDKSGNAMIVSFYKEEGIRYALHAQKVNPDGQFLWGHNGVLLDTIPNLGSVEDWVASDSQKGLLITWFGHTIFENNYDAFAQRVDSLGHLPWGMNGTNLSRPGFFYDSYPSIVANGNGGAIVAWQSYLYPQPYKVYVQKIYKNGQVGCDTTTGVPPLFQKNQPAIFTLEQNYPNPFNNTTTIAYNLAVPVSKGEILVNLKIFNMLGEEVITLINEKQKGGRHATIWTGKGKHGKELSSGIYFYILKAGTFLHIKKMTLLR